MIQSLRTARLNKYTRLLIAVSLFLIFNLLVLALNFYASSTLDNDAVSINLAGRQRMLSQRTAKVLLSMQADAALGRFNDKNTAELKKVVNLFDSTLNSFTHGGTVLGGDENPVYLSAASTTDEKLIVKKAQTIWAPYKTLLQPVIDNTIPSEVALHAATNYARLHNLELLKLMNLLTTELESATRAKASMLQTIQTVALILSLLLFANIVFNALRKLRAADAETEKAQRETSEILNTVKEGLFLLDPTYLIGSQYSSSLSKILGHEISASISFMPLLESMVDQATYDSTREYITLLFGNRVKENLVISLNPLSQVKVESVGELPRYLSFQFNRVVENKTVIHLLVTVQDITERVIQASQLDALKDQGSISIDMLKRLLNADQFQLRQFLSNASKAIEHVNWLLATFDKHTHSTVDLINECFRTVHELKGEATALAFVAIEIRAHQFEETLVQLRDKTTWSSEEFLGLPTMLNGLHEQVQQIETIVTALESYSAASFGPSACGKGHIALTSESIRNNLNALVIQLSQNQHKEVILECDLKVLNQFSKHIANELQQMSIQLIRNAISHGIETPLARLEKGKARQGKIIITSKIQINGGLTLTLRDDGAGIVPSRIRSTMQQSGRYSVAQTAALNDEEIVLKLFEPGFSTASCTNINGGYGVGLDLVQTKINKIGGQLKIDSQPDEYTQFTIQLPVSALNGLSKTNTVVSTSDSVFVDIRVSNEHAPLNCT